jgi:hypothetical protein
LLRHAWNIQMFRLKREAAIVDSLALGIDPSLIIDGWMASGAGKSCWF